MKERFTLLPTPLDGLQILQRQPVGDERGYLERLYCAEALRELLAGRPIAQINHTLTRRRGAVRGLHYQRPPHAEIKLVTCLRGAVFDVAVDLRPASPACGRWHGELLTAGNHKTLVIPEGYAHGFQTLEDDCALLYLHTAAYQADAEAGLHVLSPELAISWPLAITALSERDQRHPMRLDHGLAGENRTGE